MEITALSQLDLTKSYNYFDYLSWKFSERVELFKGKVFKMSPAPASQHQRLSNTISYRLNVFLDGQLCEIFSAPFDVRLERKLDEKYITSVVQPDICVICDPTKIDHKGCLGAPDLVIEILSPGNSDKEMKIKFELYQEAGVEEYWIVDSERKLVWQYSLKNGIFVNNKPLVEGDVLKSSALKGFEINTNKIFTR